VHRDDRRRRHAVLETAEIVGRDDVVGAYHGAPRLVVLDARQAQAGGRVDHGEIRADLVEPLVQHLRHHRRRPVESVLGLAVPEIGQGDPALVARLRGHLERLGGRVHRRKEPCGGLVADGLAHLLAEDREEFEPVAVAVDDRVLEAGVDFRGAQMLAHVLLREVVGNRV
jgi:hypothetical protein